MLWFVWFKQDTPTKAPSIHKGPSMRTLVIAILVSFLVACGGNSTLGTSQPTADTTPPVITLQGSSSLSIEQGSAYNDPGASATDNQDGSVEVEVSGTVGSQPGTYTLTYSATDSANNSTSTSRTVTVTAVSGTVQPIDGTKWFQQTIIPNGSGWFNNEQQIYTDRTENSYVSNGTLKIVAKREQFTDQAVTKQFTSARLNSKFAFKYGRVEVRAKLPSGHGTWPAIWMLGKNINERGAYWQQQGFGTTGWPQCGELDIMEHWGRNQNYVQSAIHSPSSFGGTINHGGQYVGTVSTDFHTYSMDWSSERMIFKVDGIEHYTYDPVVKDADSWPFDAEMYLLLNVAIEDGISSAFRESEMEIDYVRIYTPDAAPEDAPIWSDEFN